MAEEEVQSIDMSNCDQIRTWMLETVVYTKLSNAKEVDEQQARQECQEHIVNRLPQGDNSFRQVAEVVITRAEAIIDETAVGEGRKSPLVESFHVNKWVLSTLAMCNMAVGRPFTHEELEAQAVEHVINQVQGNKRGGPVRADLDMVVQRTVRYARELLGPSSA